MSFSEAPSYSSSHHASNLLKPSFIIFNVCAYIAYILAVLSFNFKPDT